MGSYKGSSHYSKLILAMYKSDFIAFQMSRVFCTRLLLTCLHVTVVFVLLLWERKEILLGQGRPTHMEIQRAVGPLLSAASKGVKRVNGK